MNNIQKSPGCCFNCCQLSEDRQFPFSTTGARVSASRFLCGSILSEIFQTVAQRLAYAVEKKKKERRV